MCSVIGIYGEAFADTGASLSRDMSSTLMHRGPDDSGIFHKPDEGLFLAHNRLSVIDLSERGHQPMSSSDDGGVLAFNGEIFNHKELRRNLEAQGHHFSSSSDTEVLLKCFSAWGVDCLSMIKGMFAILYWSQCSRTLHVVRDPMGIKPLYYSELPRGDGVVLASEIKAFQKLPDFKFEVDRRSLKQFLEFGYSFDDSRTIFKNIYKIPPGHRMEVHDGRISKFLRYHHPTLRIASNVDKKETEETLFSILSTVMTEHMVADVPVGLLLSGGLDSSILAALAARHGKIHTYSMGFANSDLDERRHARIVSDYIGSQHEEIFVSPEEVLWDLEDAVGYFDDLFADWGMISTRLLYRKCRDRGIKVVIAGEGSDELFGGYDVFRHALSKQGAQVLEWRLFKLYRAYAGRRYGSQWFAFRSKMKEYLEMTDGDFFSAIRLFESRDQLPNNHVMKVDKASMAVSVEARVPFLDVRVAEVAYGIPGGMLVDAHGEKKLLRSMARSYDLLPTEVIDRPKFGGSIAVSWMNDSSSFSEYARDVILDRSGWTDELGLRGAMTDFFAKGVTGYRFPRPVSIFRNLAWRLLLLNLWSRFYLGTNPNGV